MHTPPSRGPDRTASHLVPMATAQHHLVPGRTRAPHQRCSPCPGRKPAPCGRRDLPRWRPRVAQTPPPRLPRRAERPQQKNQVRGMNVHEINSWQVRPLLSPAFAASRSLCSRGRLSFSWPALCSLGRTLESPRRRSHRDYPQCTRTSAGHQAAHTNKHTLKASVANVSERNKP